MFELHTQLELDVHLPNVAEAARDKQKRTVTKFFEKNSEALEQAIHGIWTNSQHTEFERVAGVCIRSFIPFSVEIERASSTLPNAVFEAFSRQLWYSQYNFADIHLVRVEISSRRVFLLFHLGVVADGWDNEIGLLEVFTEQGDFICATDTVHEECSSRNWYERQITHQDYEKYTKGCPVWSGDIHSEPHTRVPLWTEESLIEAGATVERAGTTIRITVDQD